MHVQHLAQNIVPCACNFCLNDGGSKCYYKQKEDHTLLLTDCNDIIRFFFISTATAYASFHLCLLNNEESSFDEPVFFWRFLHVILIIVCFVRLWEYMRGHKWMRLLWNEFYVLGSCWKLSTEILKTHYISH